MNNTLFIAIEGSDGAGKTTIRRKIYEFIKKQNQECLVIGKHSWLIPKYAKVIINAKKQTEEYSSDVILEAYGKDAKAQWERTITNNISDYHVMADRYIYSDIVYLDILYSIPMEKTYDYYRKLKIGAPDIIIYVDTPPDQCEERILTKRGLIDVYGQKKIQDYWETEETLKKIQDRYKILFSSSTYDLGLEIIYIDNFQDEVTTLNELEGICEKLFKETKTSNYNARVNI